MRRIAPLLLALTLLCSCGAVAPERGAIPAPTHTPTVATAPSTPTIAPTIAPPPRPTATLPPPTRSPTTTPSLQAIAARAYRERSEAAVRLAHSGVDEVLGACLLQSGACATALARGLPRLHQGAGALRALDPPPACAALHRAALRLVAADETLLDTLEALGADAPIEVALANTRREAAEVAAAREAWGTELQFGPCGG